MFNDFMWTQKDALKNIQDSKKIGVWDLMLVVPCSNTNRAMKLLILGVGFFAWFQNFKLVKYLLCSFVSDCWISETKKNLKWNFSYEEKFCFLVFTGDVIVFWNKEFVQILSTISRNHTSHWVCTICNV